MIDSFTQNTFLPRSWCMEQGQSGKELLWLNRQLVLDSKTQTKSDPERPGCQPPEELRGWNAACNNLNLNTAAIYATFAQPLCLFRPGHSIFSFNLFNDHQLFSAYRASFFTYKRGINILDYIHISFPSSERCCGSPHCDLLRTPMVVPVSEQLW